ncbi:MAG: 2-amino-4-hydroxy-6-hydroxymethyldihydropteridine diphosphokinase, partial [Armatimonadota bacterium]|nr:2-amino-4-hydroxy-6-hydroxymethyldihydropteridine diphosphokinase [Armatimonadota bacterium]
MEKTVYLGLGSNLGDRAANLREAIRRLNEGNGCKVVRCSSIYESKPVGVVEQPDFLNAVVEVATALPPFRLLEYCQAIEDAMGRVRTIRWGPRVIDIDILLYNQQSLRTDKLVIPHPEMLNRAFVLVPL